MTKENTRITILEVAAQHFADHGFEGARMDKIARDADVNKATIYYNIGNKEDLYATVLNSSFKQNLDELKQQIESDKSAPEKLQAYIDHMASGLKKNPTLAKILMREQLSQGRHLPESFAENIVQMLDCLTHILNQGLKEDCFEPADTVTIHFMMLGTMVFQMTSSPIRKQKKAFPDKYQAAPGVLPDAVVRQISRSIFKALKKD